MKISIIVPIYNSSKYLDRCISSILLQSYVNFELILINDGSTDHSLIICKKFQKCESRIILIDQVNSGVSTARNIGIKNSTGKYILFVDSDDSLNDNYIESLLNEIEKLEVDFVLQGFIRVDENGNKLETVRFANSKISVFDYEKFFFQSDIVFYLTPFSKIFKRSIIIENRLEFNKRLTYGEDNIFCLQYLKACKNIYLSDSCNYFYTLDNNSLSSKLLKPLSYLEPYQYMENLLKNDLKLDYFSNRRLIQKLNFFLTMYVNSVFIHENGNEEAYLRLLELKDWNIYRSPMIKKSLFRKIVDVFLFMEVNFVPRFLINKFLSRYFNK